MLDQLPCSACGRPGTPDNPITILPSKYSKGASILIHEKCEERKPALTQHREQWLKAMRGGRDEE